MHTLNQLPFYCLTETCNAGGWPGTAQNFPLQQPGKIAQVGGGHAEGGHRVFEQREQRHRGKTFGQGFGKETQKYHGAGFVQRRTRGVIDLDFPARQFSGDPAGKIAIGRDQGGRFAGRFEHLTQQKSDGGGFFTGRACLDEANALKRFVCDWL